MGSPDERAWAVAARQADAVHRDQLRAAGLSDEQIKWRVARGRLRRHHPAVYLTAASPPSRHTLAWAAVLYCGTRSFASHRIAAALYLPRFTAPGTIDVTVVGHNPGRTAGVAVHRPRALARHEIRYLDGLPVTSPTRIVLDLAATAPRHEVEYVMQELLYERRLTDRELRHGLVGHRRHPGAPVLHEILELEGPAGSGHTRSEAERAFLRIVRDAGLPSPRKNVRLEGAPVDAAWPQQRLIVEIDGARGHGNALARLRDRRRTERLHAAGWRVLRFTARDVLEQPLLVAAEIAAALAAAA